MTIAPAASLRAALHALNEQVADATFTLPSPHRETRVELAEELTWLTEEYLLPRLGDLGGPVVAVVLGSTGSGKSTIVNSIAQTTVTRPGVLRPTTKAPLVWAHKSHASRYTGDFLSGFSIDAEDAARKIEVIASEDPLLEHLTIIDAPDVDSVEREHRVVAEQLLGVADVVVFMSSAQRYADAVPWDILGKASDRGVPIIHVLNRMTARTTSARADYRRLLEDKGLLARAELLTVDEQAVLEHWGLARSAVAELVERLKAVSGESDRTETIAAATSGAVRRVVDIARLVGGHIEDERAEARRLVDAASGPYQRAAAELDAAVTSGTLVRDEVVARWQEFVGAGELLKAVAEGAGRVRVWFRKVFGGSAATAVINEGASDAISREVVRYAEQAARGAAVGWEADPIGRVMLADATGGALWRAGEDTTVRAQDAVSGWLGEVSAIVSERGEGRHKVARVASYGVNAAAVVLILAVFFQTGGLTGAEVGVAAGAAAAQQKLLEHVFGSAAARSLVEEARDRLRERLGAVLEDDGERFAELVAPHLAAADLPVSIRDAVAWVEAESESFFAG